MMKTIWGIDLGGTKVEGVVLNEKYETIERLRLPTGKENGYDFIIGQIAKVVDLLAEKVGYRPTTLGIGTPGTIDPTTQTLKNSNTTCMNGMPVKRDLERALGFEIKMANDANCFALAEAKMGIVPDVDKNAKVVFGIIMGTGVGGGLIINNEVIGGRHGIGGEWGHVHLDDSGGMCYCGQLGCAETLLAGPHCERYYKSVTGKHKSLKDIYADHLNGSDAASTQTIERLLEMFGRGLAMVINMIDPDCIVIGGGVGNIDLLYTEGVKRVEKYIFNPILETKILKPKLGDSAGVFGAAMLVG
jgi:fructokinase